MRIDIISAQPNLLESFFQHSIMQRAQDKGLLEVVLHDLRDYAVNKHGQIDDYQYGGGAGMVMMVEPIAKCIRSLQNERTYDEIIYMTPDGEKLEQRTCNNLSLKKNLIILCGHYKGIDDRVREMFVSMEISVGDFVVSGGELPAALLTDAIGRLIPNVLNNETSALTDSFQDNLLAPPVYTRPASFEDREVPPLLLSGDFKKIEQWRYEKAVEKTQKRRPDLLDRD